MNVKHLWVLWFGLKRFYIPRACKMSSRARGYDLPNKARTWKPPVQGFPSHPLVKIYSKGSLIFSEPTAFLSVALSCPWADRKVHGSHGYWIQNVGMDLFSWNKEIFAIYSCSQTQRILFPQKQRASILKKDQWTVIVLSFLRRVSFPVLHQLWLLFPWWKGQHSVCIVSIMVPYHVLCFPLDVSLSQCPLYGMWRDSELMQMDATVL